MSTKRTLFASPLTESFSWPHITRRPFNHSADVSDGFSLGGGIEDKHCIFVAQYISVYQPLFCLSKNRNSVRAMLSADLWSQTHNDTPFSCGGSTEIRVAAPSLEKPTEHSAIKGTMTRYTTSFVSSRVPVRQSVLSWIVNDG